MKTRFGGDKATQLVITNKLVKETTMCYENAGLKRPKQLKLGGKRKYCCTLVCKNGQHYRDSHETNMDMFKFPDKDLKVELCKLWCNKIKTFCRASDKDSF